MQIKIRKWYDLHAHFRQGEIVAPLIAAQLGSQCAGILAMPNTLPPVGKVLKTDAGAFTSIEEYSDTLMQAGADAFENIVVPLYLTSLVTPGIIIKGAQTGILQACKYYPPHGTTNAGSAAPMQNYIDNGVLQAMSDNGIILCIHGEAHGLHGHGYFDAGTNAEEIFYTDVMPDLVQKFPDLKIVCEHITTKKAVDFVKACSRNVMATITPQHLLYTVGDLLQGLKYHLYCLPLLKFDTDRQALRDAVINADNTKFFAGTDSAPHVEKVTECGCAAGCYTGSIAPQLYAQAFEAAGVDFNEGSARDVFERFMSIIGPEFYGFTPSNDVFVLEKKPQDVEVLTAGDKEVVPLPLGVDPHNKTIPWSIVS